MIKLLITIFLALIAGCFGSKKITLSSKDGNIKMTYNCNDIKPKAESTQQLDVIMSYLDDVMKQLEQTKREVTYMTIDKMYDSEDFRGIEINIVKILCENEK